VGRFETSDDRPSEAHRPVRVPIPKGDLYRAAREMVEDLDGWRLVRADDEGHVLHCEARGGFLGGTAKVTIRVEGPDDLPVSAVHVLSESEGGLFARDKAIVASFVRPFHRRVC
jgi:hypothetical protein